MSLSLRAIWPSARRRGPGILVVACSGPSFSGSPSLYSLTRFGLARLRLLQLGFEDGAGVRIAGMLLVGVDARPGPAEDRGAVASESI